MMFTMGLALALLAGYSFAQDNCNYVVNGPVLQRAGGIMNLTDGSVWKQRTSVRELPYLELSFTVPMVLRAVSLKMRVNKNVELLIYDTDYNIMPHIYTLDSKNEKLVISNLPLTPMVKRIELHGMQMPMTAEEVTYIMVTACPHDCRAPMPCYGDCKVEPVDGCLKCVCPEGSYSSGCSGYEEKDLHILMELVLRKTRGCQFQLGYKRHVDLDDKMDECIPFSYPNCQLYRRIRIPRTKEECKRACF